MGVVYRAHDSSLDRTVALKVLRKDRLSTKAMTQLETEATLTASIHHPHVVKVFTTGTDHGRFYIAMELVNIGTLDDLIHIQGRVAETQALEIAIQVADGLRAAQLAGMIHRDVKPGNILFADSHTAKIVDFGLAVLEEAAAEAAGADIWGTPYYVAPEKLDQQPEDLRSDIYSLGATIFHALAGRPPFEAENASKVALKHLKSQAVSLQAFAPWVSGSTAFVINRSLQKNPDDRYQTYDELIEHLEYARNELLRTHGQPPVQKRVVLETDEDQKHWGYVTIGMFAACLLAGAAGLYLLFHHTPAKQKTVASAAAGADATHSPEYESARQLLIAGKATDAANAFQTLAENGSTPSPLTEWCIVHEGLSQLVAGESAQSRAMFSALAARDIPALDLPAQKLSAFFQSLAHLASNDRPTGPEDLRDFDRNGYGSLAFFVLGLKEWNAGRIDNAGTLLRDFVSTAPKGDDQWVAGYKSLAAEYVADFTDYRGALARIKDAKSAGQIKRMQSELDEIKAGLRRGKAVAKDIDSAVTAQLQAIAERKKAGSAAHLSVPLGTNRLGWWKFNEKSGLTAANSAAQKLDGTLSGGVSWGPGPHGNALIFDGTGRVNFGTGPSMDGKTPFTISAWITTEATSTQVIVQQRCESDSTTNGYTGEYQLSVLPQGAVKFMLCGRNTPQCDLQGSIAVNDGKWHNIVAVREGGDQSLYIDGELDNTVTAKEAVMNPTIRVSVGVDSRDHKSYFKGAIDDLEIWTRALSEEEIAAFKNRTWQ